jgi:hypothetical protein
VPTFSCTNVSFWEARNPMSCSNTVLLLLWMIQGGIHLSQFPKFVPPNRTSSLDLPCPAGQQRNTALKYTFFPSLPTSSMSFRKQQGASNQRVLARVCLLIPPHFIANPLEVWSVTSKTCCFKSPRKDYEDNNVPQGNFVLSVMQTDFSSLTAG